MEIRYDERWNLINACTLWHIWRRRCTACFDNFLEPPVETIKAIWCDLLHTLKGQFDSIQGESDKANKERHAFYKLWDHMGMYTRSTRRPKWLFSPPIWLYPPPIT